jgi:hypothetical protein
VECSSHLAEYSSHETEYSSQCMYLKIKIYQTSFKTLRLMSKVLFILINCPPLQIDQPSCIFFRNYNLPYENLYLFFSFILPTVKPFVIRSWKTNPCVDRIKCNLFISIYSPYRARIKWILLSWNKLESKCKIWQWMDECSKNIKKIK